MILYRWRSRNLLEAHFGNPLFSMVFCSLIFRNRRACNRIWPTISFYVYFLNFYIHCLKQEDPNVSFYFRYCPRPSPGYLTLSLPSTLYYTQLAEGPGSLNFFTFFVKIFLLSRIPSQNRTEDPSGTPGSMSHISWAWPPSFTYLSTFFSLEIWQWWSQDSGNFQSRTQGGGLEDMSGWIILSLGNNYFQINSQVLLWLRDCIYSGEKCMICWSRDWLPMTYRPTFRLLGLKDRHKLSWHLFGLSSLTYLSELHRAYSLPAFPRSQDLCLFKCYFHPLSFCPKSFLRATKRNSPQWTFSCLPAFHSEHLKFSLLLIPVQLYHSSWAVSR